MRFYLHLQILFVIALLTAVGPNSASAALRCEQVYGLSSSSALPSAERYQGQDAVVLRSFIQGVNKSALEARNPYTLVHDVLKLDHTAENFHEDLAALKAIFKQAPGADRMEALNEWVRSEEHALYLYDLLNSVGLSHFQDELSYLHENNVYFISSYKSGEGFITYAFEKEGSSGDISLLYRAPEVSDDQWLSMPESERMERLKNIKIRLKTFIDSNKIAPTGLKPDALGGYSQELNSATNTSYGWEVSHKKYEINLQRVLREIKDVTKIFKETHSIHAHVAFEIPQNYAEYENFIYWYKHFNDYLYLKGMEEGLHGNDLTSVANMADDMKENNSWGERIQRWIQRWRGIEPLPDPLSQNIVVEKQKDLGATNSKFFSAGLRGKIYGPASEGNAKIGIELRDSTRNLNLLGHYMQSLSVSIQNRIWENSDLALVKKNSLRLTSSAPKALKEIGSLVRPDDARLFAKVEPTVYFGLVHFENMAIYNYKTKTWQQVPPDVRARLQQARAQYEHDLVALQTELEEKKAKGEHVDDELVKLAIRMSLAGWAKQAKASELFENY